MGEDRGLVLVVEDEPTIADLERLYLADGGFGVHIERDGGRALEAVARLRPVAIVLDIGIPGMDGLELCRTLRARGDWTPVVFVTARDDEVDRILGLELGADDYLTKPFSPRELVARVRALIRRASVPSGAPVRTIGTVVLDPLRRRVEVGGARVELTATEFDLLEHLMSQPGRVFTREQLLSSVWGVADYSSSRTVDVHVAQVRLKLGSAASVIHTVRGVGYSAAEQEA
ncbi:response regulator transcription factor [Leifsonia virtsii]|uniref:Response regulator transcription factor n=1 Tax=Leifsonia virtsii TaxID=3035915 RepID=A0ABT8J2V1_9MICO|nr:response regulator transcription factor [Leifsonia virtsii]MDN4598936.1 response regulator transcription factor [Leifsonia virtsii]